MAYHKLRSLKPTPANQTKKTVRKRGFGKGANAMVMGTYQRAWDAKDCAPSQHTIKYLLLRCEAFFLGLFLRRTKNSSNNNRAARTRTQKLGFGELGFED
jgi:hypothetical protein